MLPIVHHSTINSIDDTESTEISTGRRMDKEVTGCIHNGIVLSLQSNTSDSVLIRWRNLEFILQSEVCQKEKDRYILTHMNEI